MKHRFFVNNKYDTINCHCSNKYVFRNELFRSDINQASCVVWGSESLCDEQLDAPVCNSPIDTRFLIPNSIKLANRKYLFAIMKFPAQIE